MNKQFFIQRLPLAFFLLFYLLFSLFTYKDYGVSFDEKDVYYRGKWLYMKVRGNDKVLQKDFVVPQPGTNLALYSSAYPAFLYAINGKEDFSIYHLLNLFFGGLLFIFIYEMLIKYYKKIRIALLGPIFLFFTPRIIGDIPSNPKDIPFATAYFISMALIFLTSDWDRVLRIILLGLSFGAAQSLRLVGYTIYPVYITYRILLNWQEKRKWRAYFDLFTETAAIFLIGYLVHMATLPYLGADPFNHFVDLMNVTKNFPWRGTLLIFGKVYNAPYIPWFYLPVWFVVTTPLFIQALSLSGLIMERKKNNLYRLIVLSLFINLSFFFILKPVIYDGIRHMVYLLPQIILLSVIGFYNVYRKLKINLLRYCFIFFVAINMLLVIKDMIQLHPYEYTYFNEVVGGLKGAYGKFELDYWGEANGEATKWIRNRVDTLPGTISVYVCGDSYSVMYYFSKNMTFENDYKKANYVVCWERFGDNKKVKGKLVYTVKRQGVPLVHVYQNER